MQSVWLCAAIVVVGCSSGPVFEVDPGSTVTWTPDVIELQRIPAHCGMTNPPFDDLDLYNLSVSDTQGLASVYIVFVRTDMVDHDYPISLGPLIANLDQQSGITAVNTTSETNGDVNFSYFAGDDLMDAHQLPLASVTVRFSALPQFVGDVLVATTTIEFFDGGVFSFTARPTLPGVDRNPCPQV